MERETGIEPATNGLGSRDSTTELLPLSDEASIQPRDRAARYNLFLRNWLGMRDATSGTLS